MKPLKDYIVPLMEASKPRVVDNTYDPVSRSPKKPVTLNPYNTFIIIKPGFTKQCKEIISRFTDAGYTVSRSLARRISLKDAQDIYSVHKDEDFYDNLCKYMSGGLSIGLVLQCPDPDAINKTKKLKDAIRAEFGKDDMRNALHSSDSEENVYRESEIYFKP